MLAERDERVDVILPGATPPVAHDHACHQRGRNKRLVITAPGYALPRCMADAIGARGAVAQQQRVHTQQPVIVQRLHCRDTRIATTRMDRRRNLHPEVVYVSDIRLPLITDPGHTLSPAVGPAAGPSEAGELRSSCFVVRVLCPYLDA